MTSFFREARDGVGAWTFGDDRWASGPAQAPDAFVFHPDPGNAVPAAGYAAPAHQGSVWASAFAAQAIAGTFELDAPAARSVVAPGPLISVNAVDDYRDVFNDGSEPLGSLPLGGTAGGTIEVVGDQDIFAVSLAAGRTYTFQVQGASSGFTLADPSFYFRDGNGAAIDFSAGIGGGSTDDRLIFTARTTGTFYIDVLGGGGTGTYRLVADTGYVDDYRDVYNDTNEALGSLTLGGTAGGTIEVVGDQDIFAVSLAAGRTYTFQVQGASSGYTVADPSFYLRDSTGAAIDFSAGIGGGSTDDRLIFTARTTGTYYLDVFGGAGTGTYRLVADTGYVDDYRDVYNDTNEALGSIAPGGTANGTIEVQGDQDIFAVSLVSGQTYTFEMQGVSSGLTLADPGFYLRDSTGAAIDFSTGIGGGSTNDRLVHTATATGTYYIDAFGSGTGTYKVVWVSGFVDDYRDVYNDPTEALGSIAPGGSATGSIEIQGDQDIFAIDLVAGKTYTFQMEGASSGFTQPDPAFYLRNSTGAALGFSTNVGGGNTNDALTFAVTASGRYYLDAFGSSTGTYRLIASSGVTTPDDYRDVYNDPSEPLGSISPGMSKTGSIEIGGDKDVFAITLVAGQSYTFDLAGSANGGTPLGNAYLSLLNAAGALIVDNNNYIGVDSRIVYTAASSGTFYLEAKGATASFTGNYLLSAKAAFDDYRNTFNGAGALGALVANGSSFGSIEKGGDKDVFAISLVAGQTYTFDLVASNNGGAALGNPYLSLLNAAGALIVDNNNYIGVNARIVYTATSSGTFYLEAKGATASFTGNYLLSAKTPFDDFRNTFNGAGTLGALAVNGSSFGSIETGGDKDVFAITLVAGQSYTFDMVGSSNGGTPLGNSYLSLLNAAGVLIVDNNNYIGVDSRIVYTAASSGTFYLEAKGATASFKGNYMLSAKAAFDDYRNTFDGAGALGALAANGSSFGSIEKGGDKDVFAVSLVAGHSYTFDLAGSTNGGVALFNTYLTLLNGTGSVLLSNDNFNGYNAHLFYTATVSGTFYLEAKGATASLTGNYVLSAKADFDDYRNTFDGAGTLGALAVDGAVNGTLEKGGDKDVFAITLVAGQSYTFDLTGSSNGGAALGNPHLSLLNAAGVLIVDNNNFNGVNSRVVYTAESSGIFYLEAKGATASFKGNYLLTSKLGFDDHADSITDKTSPMGVLSAGVTRQATIETAGDSDFFRFDLVAGHKYAFSVTGGSGAGQLADPDLHLLDATGTQLAYSDDANGTFNPEIVFTATATGVHYLDVGGVKTGIGGYVVGFLELP